MLEKAVLPLLYIGGTTSPVMAARKERHRVKTSRLFVEKLMGEEGRCGSKRV